MLNAGVLTKGPRGLPHHRGDKDVVVVPPAQGPRRGFTDMFGRLCGTLTCGSRTGSELCEGAGFQVAVAQHASELACQPGGLAGTGQGHHRREVISDGVQQVSERARVVLLDPVPEALEQTAGAYDRGGAVGMHVEAEDRVAGPRRSREPRRVRGLRWA